MNSNLPNQVHILSHLEVKMKSNLANAFQVTQEARFVIHSNLSIADMLFNGHLVVADTCLGNWSNHGQTLIEKPLYSRHCCSGHLLLRTLFWALREHFGKNIPLHSWQPVIGWEIRKHKHVFVWHISLLEHEAH